MLSHKFWRCLKHSAFTFLLGIIPSCEHTRGRENSKKILRTKIDSKQEEAEESCHF